jgi:tRNA threonylcarbamoyladenosine biosynthesis protein TsaB
MRVLALDAALSRCAAALVEDGELRADEILPVRQGHTASLPRIVQTVFERAQVRSGDIDLIAVTIGPGSFTGIRTGLAFARGLAMERGIPVIGVTIGEALSVSLRHIKQREIWSVVESGRSGAPLDGAAPSGIVANLGVDGPSMHGSRVRSPGMRATDRVFLERLGEAITVSLDALPRPVGPVAIAGNAAPMVAARLAAQGFDVLLTDVRIPAPRDVAIAGQAQWSGGSVRPPRVLYVDVPAAKLPAGGLRPAPAS